MGFYFINAYLLKNNPFSGSCRSLLSSRFSALFLDKKGLKQSLEKKLNLPERPKKPLTAFFKFMKQLRPNIIAEYPKLSVTEVSKKISLQWENIDPKVKADLQTQYQKEKEEYDKARLKYESSLTNDQKEALEQEKFKIIETKTKRKLKQKAKELEKPKRPPSSYVLFVLSRSNSRGTAPVTEWQKVLSKEWKELTETEKNKFINQQNELMQKYMKELALWEDKMIKLGHVDLLRTESLLPKEKPKK